MLKCSRHLPARQSFWRVLTTRLRSTNFTNGWNWTKMHKLTNTHCSFETMAFCVLSFSTTMPIAPCLWSKALVFAFVLPFQCAISFTNEIGFEKLTVSLTRRELFSLIYLCESFCERHEINCMIRISMVIVIAIYISTYFLNFIIWNCLKTICQ